MRSISIFGGSYSNKKHITGIWLLLLTTAVVMALVPIQVFAFTTLLPLPSMQYLQFTPLSLEKDDEETEWQEYDYSNSGVAISNASPLTEVSKRIPVKKHKASLPSRVIIEDGSSSQLILEGEASYYSWNGCLGCNPLRIMANGQQLNDNALTMAIGADRKHLVGHTARVTSLSTGKSVDVRITDTGGFYQAKYGHRVADLSVATKNAIGMAGGTGQVRVEVF